MTAFRGCFGSPFFAVDGDSSDAPCHALFYGPPDQSVENRRADVPATSVVGYLDELQLDSVGHCVQLICRICQSGNPCISGE